MPKREKATRVTEISQTSLRPIDGNKKVRTCLDTDASLTIPPYMVCIRKQKEIDSKIFNMSELEWNKVAILEFPKSRVAVKLIIYADLKNKSNFRNITL